MEAAAPRRTRALAAVAGACVLGALALSRVASAPKDAVVALSAASQPKETAAALSAAFGGDTDAEGCYTDAGYSWCAASSSCVRSWESSCDWVRSSRAAADATLSLVFALPVGDDHVAALEAEVAAVSDPASKRYGRHRSVAELDAYRADAHPEWATHASRILSYLDVHGKQFGEAVAYGSADEAAKRGFLRAEVSVASAEELLGGEYYEFARVDGQTATRCVGCSLPENLRSAAAFVEPTSRFPNLRRKSAPGAPLATDGKYGVTPGILRDEYGLGGAYPSLTNRSEHYVVVTAFDGEFASPADAKKFYKDYAPDLASSGYAPTIEGPNRGNRPGAEANLDVQYASAVSGGVPLEVWSFAGMSPDRPAINEPFLEFVLYMNGVDHAPSVVSTSYGEDEGSTSDAYAVRVQYEFGLAALRGMSLIFAAGDSGVASTSGQTP